MKNIKGNYIYYLLIIIIISAFWGRYFQIKNITNIDEYESLAVPMFFSNIHWVQSHSFHGYGATILLMPLVYLIKIIGNYYWLFLLECLVIRIVCSCICFWICEKKLNVNKWLALLTSLICNIGSLGVTDSAGLSAMTEQPLCLIVMLIALWTIDFVDNKDLKKRIIAYAKILGIILYGITLHSRILVLVVTVVLLFIALLAYRRISLLETTIYLAVGSVLFSLVNKGNDYFISKIYGNSTEMNTISSVVTFGKTENVSMITNFRDTLYGFFSLIESFTFFSYGFIVLAVLLNVWNIYLGLKKNRIDAMWALSFIGLSSFLGMNFLLSYASKNWLRVGEFKFLTYTRYSIPFTWMLVMTGIVLLYKHLEQLKMIGLYSVLVSIALTLHFIYRVAEVLDKTKYGMGTSIFARFYYHGGSVKEYFIFYTVILLLVQSCICLFIYKKQFIFAIIPYLLASFFLENALFNHFKSEDDRYTDLYDSSLALVMNDCCENLEKIYVYSDNSSVAKKFEARVGYIQLEDDTNYELENGVLFVFSKALPDVESIKDYLIVKLDENEYIITANQKLYNSITGYSLH